MLRVSDEIKTLFKSDNVHKELEVVITMPEGTNDIVLTNNDILVESMHLTEAIETGNNLSFTGCIASRFEIETVDLIQDIQGKFIQTDLYLPDIEEPIPIFKGYIDTVTGTSHEEYSMKLSCLDALYHINNADVTTWYNSLTFPISIKNMRDSFFAYLGIEQEADYLANDTFMVAKTIEDAVINGEAIIKAICQLNGRFGRIGRSGKFQYVHLVEGTEAIYPADTLYPADDLYPHAENAVDNVNKAHYTSINFESYRVTPIDKVQLTNRDGVIVSSAGIGSNAFTIKGNPLIYDKNSNELSIAAQNLYNDINGLWYVPADVHCIGLPYVECGDFVLMACRRTQVRAYVLQRSLTGIQSLKDNYSAKGDIKQPLYVVSLTQKVGANTSAIKNEVSRATDAETAERNRAVGVESNLNRSIGDANNRINSVYSDLIDTRNLVATKASIADLQVTNNLVATKANISDLNVTNGRIDNLQARMITASTLSTGVNGVRISNNYVYCTALALGSYTVSQGWAQTRARSGSYNVYKNGAVIGTVSIGT